MKVDHLAATVEAPRPPLAHDGRTLAANEPALEARMATLGERLATLVRGPRSTVEPPRPDSDDRTRKALAAWQAIAAATPHAQIALGRTLGEGGMGVVHLAEQTTLGRKVAVKRLRDGAEDRDATLKLLREAWITGAVEHPNVVPIHDVRLDPSGGPQIVLKRIEGVAWSEVIAAPDDILRRFGATDPLEWNLRILLQVCRALHFAHARGVLHRDVKPDNVMIGEFGEVYVLDWGIAVALEDDGSGRLPLAREANDMAGTPAYMAPEMLGGHAEQLGPRTDVYLLGAVLHHIVTGRPPHDGPTTHALLSSILLSSPSFGHEVPRELARIATRALAAAPAERFPSADALREELEVYLRQRGSHRLAEDAARSLSRLREELAERPSRSVLYNLLGECRFGYRAALRASADNEFARDGLRAALRAIAEWELAQGDPESAALLIDELDDVAPDLRERLAEARRRRGEEQLSQQRAAALARQLDKSTGAATRTVLAVMLGVFWSSAPLVREHLVPVARRTHGWTLLADVAQAFLIVTLGVWARESLGKTAINRRLFATLLSTPLIQIMLDLALWRAGIPAPTLHWMHAFVWTMLLASVTIHVERALWPSLVAMACVFVAGATQPTWLPLALAMVNLFAMVNMVVVWSPWRLPLDPRGHGAPMSRDATKKDGPA